MNMIWAKTNWTWSTYYQSALAHNLHLLESVVGEKLDLKTKPDLQKEWHSLKKPYQSQS